MKCVLSLHSSTTLWQPLSSFFLSTISLQTHPTTQTHIQVAQDIHTMRKSNQISSDKKRQQTCTARKAKKEMLEIMRRDSAKFMRISWKQRQRRKRNRRRGKVNRNILYFLFLYLVFLILLNSSSLPPEFHSNELLYCIQFRVLFFFCMWFFPSFIQNFSFSLFTFFASSCFPPFMPFPVQHRFS